MVSSFAFHHLWHLCLCQEGKFICLSHPLAPIPLPEGLANLLPLPLPALPLPKRTFVIHLYFQMYFFASNFVNPKFQTLEVENPQRALWDNSLRRGMCVVGLTRSLQAA